MSLISDLPAWLENFRPDDNLYADAYEGTPAELRALLKTAIAFAFHRWKQDGGEYVLENRSTREGFIRTEHVRPAAWVMAVTAEGFASPARFLAALVPAVIAGTGRIAVVSPTPFAPAVSTALELAGLEDSFVLDENRLAALYNDLHDASPDGRIVVFPDGRNGLSPGQKALLHTAAADGVPLYRDRPSPRLLTRYGDDDASAVPGTPSSEEIRKRLLWLHPDAEILSEGLPDALYLPNNVPSSPAVCKVPFTAGPGMEGCWPGPTPAFFQSSTFSAFLVQENQS